MRTRNGTTCYFLVNGIISWESLLGPTFCKKEAVVKKMWVPRNLALLTDERD